MRFVFLTMDGNHFAALREGARLLHCDEGIALNLACYDANALRTDADRQRLADDVAASDFVFGSMLFGEEFVRPLESTLAQATARSALLPAIRRSSA